MKSRIVSKFTYGGITYVAQDYTLDKDTNHQCELCDLNVGCTKLCFKSDCECGECGAVYGGRRRIFVAQNLSDNDRAAIREKKYADKVKRLESEIEDLKSELSKVRRESSYRINELNTKTLELTQKVNRLKNAFITIHDSASEALVKEFNNKK